jgi:diadenosine tetraphosphate (Ap4A) HIT family hydrolase
MLAFYDIQPAAETHILIIPAAHIESVKTVQPPDYDLLLKMKAKALDLLKEHGHQPENCRYATDRQLQKYNNEKSTKRDKERDRNQQYI